MRARRSSIVLFDIALKVMVCAFPFIIRFRPVWRCRIAGARDQLTGPILTSGGVWTDASSREYKEHIAALSTTDAMRTFAGLTPVTYNYKTDPQEKHVGFIAEDVPDLVATPDRRSLSPMDIAAVLTSVQEKSRALEEQTGLLRLQREMLEEQKLGLRNLKDELSLLAAEVGRLRAYRLD
jgi:hypothetical protein